MLMYIFQRDEILSSLDKSISNFIPWTFAVNVLGTISIITIAAGSSFFCCSSSNDNEHDSKPEETSASKEYTADAFRNAGSMERGRDSGRRVGGFDRERSKSSSLDRERRRSVSLERDRGKVRVEPEEKSFLNLSSRLTKVVEEADIAQSWVIKFPDEELGRGLAPLVKEKEEEEEKGTRKSGEEDNAGEQHMHDGMEGTSPFCIMSFFSLHRVLYMNLGVVVFFSFFFFFCLLVD